MKKITLLALVAAAALIGCTATQQQVAVKTLATLEDGTTQAYTAYMDEVIQGTIPTNNAPFISQKYNQFQQHWLLALDLVQFNTNAIAPSSLIVESQDVLNIINTYQK